jgi:hypothetical protein
MKNIIIITFSIILLSCTNVKNTSTLTEWSEEDKDIIFKQCISWGLSSKNMDISEANDYCYCSLEIIIENFKNRDDVIEQMEIDRSQSDLWIGCIN